MSYLGLFLFTSIIKTYFGISPNNSLVIPNKGIPLLNKNILNFF